MVTTLCVSGAVLAKVGIGINADVSGANLFVGAVSYLDHWINQAESYINVVTRYNWTDNYSGLNSDVKLLLEEAVSNLAAVYAIQYDMSNYTSRIDAEDMINVLLYRVNEIVEILKDQVNVSFIKGA